MNSDVSFDRLVGAYGSPVYNTRMSGDALRDALGLKS
jgi:hypothetical protein